MALIFVDSFSHYTTITDKWDATSGSAMSIDATAGPRGHGALKFNGNNGNGTVVKTYPSNLVTVVHQFRIKKTGDAGSLDITYFIDNSTIQSYLLLQADLRFAAKRGDGTLLGTATNPISGNTWAYVKVKLTVANSGGRFVVIVDNVTEIDYTGDTQNTANAYVTRFDMGQGSNPALQVYWADFIVMDTSGARNNDFVSDQKVDAPLPDAAGAYSAWTPSSGLNYTDVNTSPPDTGKKVSSSTVDQKDAYHYPDAANSTIIGIADNLFAKKTGGGTTTINSLFRSNSIDALGADKAVPADFHFLQSISELSPATGLAWTPTELNQAMPERAQFGQKVIAV